MPVKRTPEEIDAIQKYYKLHNELKATIKKFGLESPEAEDIRENRGMDEFWYKIPGDVRHKINRNIKFPNIP